MSAGGDGVLTEASRPARGSTKVGSLFNHPLFHAEGLSGGRTHRVNWILYVQRKLCIINANIPHSSDVIVTKHQENHPWTSPLQQNSIWSKCVRLQRFLTHIVDISLFAFILHCCPAPVVIHWYVRSCGVNAGCWKIKLDRWLKYGYCVISGMIGKCGSYEKSPNWAQRF